MNESMQNPSVKFRVYMRLARGGRKGFKVEANPEPNYEPLSSGYKSSYNSTFQFLPTVSFAVDFEIPVKLFRQAEEPITKINVALKEAEVVGEILIPAIKRAIAETKKKKK